MGWLGKKTIPKFLCSHHFQLTCKSIAPPPPTGVPEHGINVLPREDCQEANTGGDT